eukprot:723918_1
MAAGVRANNYQGFNPESLKRPRHFRSLSHNMGDASCERLVIATVGLPARGKSYIAKKLQIYLSWKGHSCRVFNVGARRRQQGDSEQTFSADFFRSDNPRGQAIREAAAMGVLSEVVEWMGTGGQVAIFDATNTTTKRRQTLQERLTKENIRLLFIESICTDETVIQENLLVKAQRSPDFKDMNLEEAMKDLKQRITNYERVYEPLEDSEGLSYIKIINMADKLIAHRVCGRLPRSLIVFLSNLHVNPNRRIWLVRIGKSTAEATDFVVKTKEAGLNEEGERFARALGEFIRVRTSGSPLHVLSSSLPRARQTIELLDLPDVHNPFRPALSPVYQGVCYGMKPRLIQRDFPDLYSQWRSDLFRFRFPGGESYEDGVQRMEPLVVDLEQLTVPVLVVTHLSCLRILDSYFKGTNVEDCVELEFPFNQVIELTPSLYGWQEQRFKLLDNPEHLENGSAANPQVAVMKKKSVTRRETFPKINVGMR